MAGFDYKWLPATGGDATVATNWSRLTSGQPDGTLPGSADEAEFGNLGGTITGALSVYQWVIDPTAGYYSFATNTTATFFEVGASAALTGTWTQTGAGAIDISGGTFTLGSSAALISQVTGNTLGLIVDGALIANGGAITTATYIGIGVNTAGSLSENSGARLSGGPVELAVKPGSSGTLDLSGGSTASFAGFVVVGAGGGNGAIDVNNATLTAQDQLEVGLLSSGTLTVQGGGQVSTSATLTHPFLAAGGAGTTGDVVIEDAGSELNAGANQIEIGAGGTGSLTLEGGATLVAGGLFLAGGTGTGTADITGALTTATIGADALGIGEGGTGQLTLEQGATLDAATQFVVGVGSTGTFDIETGATLISQGGAIGLLSTSNVAGSGTVLLDAALWRSSAQVVVGGGTGAAADLQIDSAATLQATATLAATSPFLFINENIAGHATVDVGGANTLLDAGSNSVLIGYTGFGALTIHDGARLDAGSTGTNAAFTLGAQAGSDGTATETGATTSIDVTGDAVIGSSGAGTLSIGGTVSVSGNMFVATATTAAGTVAVSGTGSDVAITGGLLIGGSGSTSGGTASVSLTDGAALTAASLTSFAGGTLSIDATSSAELGTADAAVAGQLVIDAAVTAGGSGTIAAAVTNHGDLVAQSGTLTITGPATGNGVFDIAAGATFDLAQPGALDLRFDSTTGTAILGTASGTASLAQFSKNDTLELIGIGTGATASYAGDKATVTGSNGAWTFDFAGTAPGLVVTNQGMDAEVVACFAAGTLIATPAGEVPVQHLSAGDTVTTLSGRARRIVWIGTGRVLATSGRRNAATPVIVRRHAIGPNLPHHDLRITKGHSLYIDNVLIPVEFLVNHRSIQWDDRAQEVTVFHIELETHDVLLANGVPAESYRDDGNRWLFQNANAGWARPPLAPCAPILTGGKVLDAIWRRLLDRSGPRPGLKLTDDPDLHLRADGRRIDAASRTAGAFIFPLPTATRSVRLLSQAAIPAELGLARDARSLGVGVRRIALRHGTRFRVITAADPALSDGFYPYESETVLRWTNGDAGLPVASLQGLDGTLELVLHVAGAMQYPLFGPPVRTEAA